MALFLAVPAPARRAQTAELPDSIRKAAPGAAIANHSCGIASQQSQDAGKSSWLHRAGISFLPRLASASFLPAPYLLDRQSAFGIDCRGRAPPASPAFL